MSTYYNRKANEARAELGLRMVQLEHEAKRLTASRDALQRDYDAITARLKVEEDHSRWLQAVAVRMFRHLEALNADSLTLTSLAVALRIERQDE